ncbi:hypothetical protein [Streptomyces xanthophaeus]|uniref:hypothetical protein n=1 Tax=Streptomyces xanthophaeus TaxID=67385 RepID=UPI0037174F7C
MRQIAREPRGALSRPFEKRCRSYDLEAADGRCSPLDGTFLKLETIAEEEDLAAALDDVRAVLAELGIGDEDLTRELYTDAVRARRAGPSRS